MQDCPPCEDLLDAIREAHGHALGSVDAAIAVLRVGDSSHAHIELPKSVLQYHAPSKMQEGFLGGKITPSSFYLDRNLTLIKRRPGLPFSAKNLLQFPKQH